MEIIAIGAEAKIYREGNKLIKNRISKGYRLNEIDIKIRKFRTRREAKLLGKLDFVPKVYRTDDKNMKIEMEFIEGDLLKDVFDDFSKEKREKICRRS